MNISAEIASVRAPEWTMKALRNLRQSLLQNVGDTESVAITRP